MKDLSISVPSSGVGIDVGGDSTAAVYFYISTVFATVWINGTNASAFRVGPFNTMDNVYLNVMGEISGNGKDATGSIGLKNMGGGVKAFGHFNVKGNPHDLVLGGTKILTAYRTVSKAAGSNGDTFNTLLMANPDKAHDANIGYISGSNRSIPFVSSFDGAGAFRVYKTVTGKSPNEGTLLFNVLSDGSFQFGSAANRARILANLGAPASNSPSFGALHLRTDNPASLPLLYQKTSAGGAAGWLPIDLRRADSTANLPRAPQRSAARIPVLRHDPRLPALVGWRKVGQRGRGRPSTRGPRNDSGSADNGRWYRLPVLRHHHRETNLVFGKPIWWNGSSWRDAMGTAA